MAGKDTVKNNLQILGIGIDIVEIERVKNIHLLPRFAEYFLTPTEIEYFKKSSDPTSFIASRFAVKEALIKAFPGTLKPHDFEIRKEGKKPAVGFLPPIKNRRYKAMVSISHSTRYAAGCAIVMDA